MPPFYTSTKANPIFIFASAPVSVSIFTVKKEPNEPNEDSGFFYSDPRFIKKPVSRFSIKVDKKLNSRWHRTTSVFDAFMHQQYNNPNSFYETDLIIFR